MNRNNIFSQPMFPSTFDNGGGAISYKGAAMIDFYATQAPPIPEWFIHTPLPDTPQEPRRFEFVFGKHSNYEHKDIIMLYHDGEEMNWPNSNVPEKLRQTVDADLKEHDIKWDEYLKSAPAWQLKNHMERISQWQFAYATHMIQAREVFVAPQAISSPTHDVEFNKLHLVYTKS